MVDHINPIDPVTGERDWSGVPREELPQERKTGFDRNSIPRPSLLKGVFWGAFIIVMLALVMWLGPAVPTPTP